MKTLLVTIALLTFSAGAAVQAQPTLPKGQWQYIGHVKNTPNCNGKIFMTIGDGTVKIISGANDDVELCKIVGIKQKKKYVEGTFVCEYSFLEGKVMSPIQKSDDIEFGIRMLSPDRMEYNNAFYGRCPSSVEAR